MTKTLRLFSIFIFLSVPLPAQLHGKIFDVTRYGAKGYGITNS